MNKEHIIRKQIERVGNTIHIDDGEWKSVPYKAVIIPLWRKKSSNFEKIFTELGYDINEYYLYIGPSSHNILSLSEDATVIGSSKKFEFRHRDEVMFDDEVLYYIGIIRLVKEAEYD